MAVRGFFLLTGFGLAVSGAISIISYLNYLTAGMDGRAYLDFISGRADCYLLPAGVAIIALSIILPWGKDEGRHSDKE